MVRSTLFLILYIYKLLKVQQGSHNTVIKKKDTKGRGIPNAQNYSWGHACVC